MKKRILRPNDRRGVALVEMALVVPIFFLVVLGIVEFGRAMMVSNMMTNAAHAGARLASMAGSTNAEVENLVKDLASKSTGAALADIAVNITVDPGTNNPDPADLLSNALKRDICTVDVQVPFEKVSFVPGSYLAGKQLTGQSVTQHE